uniref:FYN binding protein b n=1 Tax=Nothobranchius furzeri TaxID=105023 RepID=A0A8C6LIT3_NOTFU
MRARFQAGGASTEDTSSTSLGRPKQPVQSTLSGPTAQRKPVSGSLSGGLPPKPSTLKATPSSKNDTDITEPNKIKAMANRFGPSQDESLSPNKAVITNKLQSTLKPTFPQTPDAKGYAQKSPLNKPSSEIKPVLPKPPGVPTSKPSWMKEDTNGVTASNTTTNQPILPNLQQKPISNVRKMWQQSEDQGDANAETANKPPPQVNVSSKPTSNFKSAQNMFNKEKDMSESTESSMASKRPFAASSTFPPPAPPASKKPSIKKPTKFPPQANGTNDEAGPKRNPLPNSLALGPAPAKPNRPPKVELEHFKHGAEASENGKNMFIRGILSDLLTFYWVCDLNREEAEKQEKKKEDKEEKRRLEAAKKEQKERERKEQDAKKKFKLVGPLEVIQKGKALLDCRGGKVDLATKQGDHLDIIRVQGNPEGKWLARSQDGSCMFPIKSFLFPFSLSMKGRNKAEDTDPKKQKKFEKEEKDFRKKFKYEGEIKVLNQVNIIPTLSQKKWSGKDLPVKAGEKLDVIDKAHDDKWICRNEDGKRKYFF